MAENIQSEGTHLLNKLPQAPRLLQAFGNIEVIVVKDYFFEWSSDNRLSQRF